MQEIAAHYPGRLEIVSKATRSTSIRATTSAGARARIVANLPYNIATALLVGWLTVEPGRRGTIALVLMFQREVAERIVAAARQQSLWPAVGACRLAHRGEDLVRRRADRRSCRRPR